MQEADLIDGAEYEAIGAMSGMPRRGKLVLGITSPFGPYTVALTGVIAEDIRPDHLCYVTIASLRRVTPDPAPVWKVGDRVEWDDSKNIRNGKPGMCRGYIEAIHRCEVSGDYAWVALDAECQARRLSHWNVNLTLLRYAAPEIAEGDRLHETGCCLCGAAKCSENVAFGTIPGRTGLLNDGCLNVGARTCNACRNEFGGNNDWTVTDREITRRKALASGSVSSAERTQPESRSPARNGAEKPATVQAEPERPIERCACGNVAKRERFCADCYEAERKRLHYEERCAAYESQAGDAHAGTWWTSGTTPPDEDAILYQWCRDPLLDSAIARAKKPEGPAYINSAWPCDAGEDYEL